MPAGDIEAMREAVNYLLTHPGEARRMEINGRRRTEVDPCILVNIGARKLILELIDTESNQSEHS